MDTGCSSAKPIGHDGRAIANAILDACDAAGLPLSNLALQKVMYFCHMHSLVEHNVPLIRHEFEAWEHGPVIGYVYHEFKIFESGRIKGRAHALDTTTGRQVTARASLDEATTNLVKTYAMLYGRISALHLRALSHVDSGPWHTIWNHQGDINPGMRISNDAIKSFYAQTKTHRGFLNVSRERVSS